MLKPSCGALLLLGFLLACQSEPEKPTAAPAQPAAQPRTGPDVAALTGYGRHEEAIALGEELLEADPDDPKVLQDMAAAYLARIRPEPEQREQWIKWAVHYADRFARTDERDPARLFVAHGLFKKAGDLTKEDACPHYARAWQLLEKRGQLLEGGEGSTAEGLRRQNQRDADALKEILERRRCAY